MNINIIAARMTYNKDEGYLGHVGFEVEGHKHAYEITVFSKRGKEWDYALMFLNESGSEEDILAVEDVLEEDDELFERIVEAAKKELPAQD
jgi:hypothetical protein